MDKIGQTISDTWGKLLLELASQLQSCLKHEGNCAELTTDEYNRKSIDLYNKQSAEILDITCRLNQLALETSQRLVENQEIFALKKQLADAQAYIARLETLI